MRVQLLQFVACPDQTDLDIEDRNFLLLRRIHTLIGYATIAF